MSQGNEINDLVEALRATSRTLSRQTEDIAAAIGRIARVQQNFSESRPASPPPVRPITRENHHHRPRPQHESTPIPRGGHNDSHGLSPVGRNFNNTTSVGSTRSSARRQAPRPRGPFGPRDMGEVNLHVDPLLHPSFEATGTDRNCTCPSSSDAETIAQMDIKIFPNDSTRSLNTQSGRGHSRNSSRGGTLSFQDYHELMRELTNWWSRFLLENINSEAEIIPSADEFRAGLQDILSQWEDMSRSGSS